ncbi:MAG: transcriptional regulator, partial [Rhodobacteraceae bacterium]|nr:transcriptional regulator [Paracoccaceae bacterium]
MGRSTRLFELIQILRAADRPVSAARLAETL